MQSMKEITQFSRQEYLAEKDTMFEKYAKMGLADANSITVANMSVRDRMLLFFDGAYKHGKSEAPRIEALGGMSNIQRIRVYVDNAANPQTVKFEYSTVKPPAMVLAERRKAEFAKARQAETDKRAAEEKKAEAKAAARAQKRAVEEQRKQSAARRNFLLSPEGKKAAFDAAWKQRIEQSRLPQLKKRRPMTAARAAFPMNQNLQQAA